MSSKTVHKLMCFGYYFPPTQAPESIVSAKRTAGLKDWKVTFSHYQLSYDDPDFAHYAQGNFAALKAYPLPVWANRYTRKLMSIAQIKPDWLRILTRHAYQSLLKDNVQEYNVLMTCSQSHSAHLVGLKLKKKYPSLPWVAHFSDPWAKNPYLTYSPKEAELERRVFEKADLLIFTSNETLEYIAKEYPAHIQKKMRILPHSYDPRLLTQQNKNTRKKDKNRKIIRHIGALYGKRTPLPFFKGLYSLLEKKPHLAHSLCFEFVGPIDEEFKKHLNIYQFPENVVTIKPPVSYQASLIAMKEADGLLLIDAPAKENIFLPSKVIDYISCDKLILGLTPVGTTEKILTKYGAVICSPNDIEAIEDGLQTFISHLLTPEQHPLSLNTQLKYDYHIDTIGNCLNSYLKECL